MSSAKIAIAQIEIFSHKALATTIALNRIAGITETVSIPL